MNDSPSEFDPAPVPQHPYKIRATSLKQVADAAGVHVTTVSRALRNSPQIPKQTRDRIREIAEELGYSPNPMVVALMQQRRTGKQSMFQGTLAFITTSFQGAKADSNLYVGRIWRAACAQAELLGYKLDHFESMDYGNDPRRLERALHARNIRGLLFAPPIFPTQGEPDGRILPLNWDHFAPVIVSNSNVTPAIDQVDGDFFAGSKLAFATCIQRGYERPGFIALKSHDRRTQGRWRGGFLSASQESDCCEHIPVLLEDDEDMADAFETWYRQWSPDVIITNNLVLQLCEARMKQMGIRIPKDLALVETNLHDWDIPQSGIHVGLEIGSRYAVDLLVGKVNKNMLGLSSHPHIAITPPTWKEGNTLPWKKSPTKQTGSAQS